MSLPSDPSHRTVMPYSGKAMKNTTVVITEEQDRALDSLAATSATSRSAVLRQLLNIGLRVRRVGQEASDAAEALVS